MHRRRCAPRLAHRTLFCGLLVLAALGTIVSSALPGALGQSTPNDSAYVQLVDLREYAGTGFGGETAHVVRLDFQVTPNGTSTGGTTGSSSTGSTGSTTSSTTGSTTSSTTGSTTSSTTGSTTSSTTGSSTTGGTQPLTGGGVQADAIHAPSAGVPAGGKAYRGKPRPWLLRRDRRPLANEGVRLHLDASDMIDVPPSMRAAGISVRPAMVQQPTTSGGTSPTTTGSTSTTGTQTTGSTTSTTGSTTSSTTGSTTGGTTGNNNTWSTSYVNYYFGVDSSYFASFTVGGQHPASDWPGTYGISAYNVLTRGNHFEYRLPPASTNRNVYYVVDYGGQSGYYDGNGNKVVTASSHDTDVYSTALALSRRDTPTVSIDSRRVYGQPDLDGEYAADPNAEARNPSFANWIYQGGLFVGNAPNGSGDQSGTARLQAYVPAGSFTNPLASSYTLLALGRPSVFPSPPAYAAYLPSPSDPNLGSSPGTVTWSSGWNLSTSTALGDGDDLSANAFPAGGLEYSRCFFVGNASNLLVALQNEASIVSGGGGFWQYFSSPGYQAQFPNSFPVSDSSPRTWTADETNYGFNHYVLQ